MYHAKRINSVPALSFLTGRMSDSKPGSAVKDDTPFSAQYDILWRLLQFSVGVGLLIVWKGDTTAFEEEAHDSSTVRWTFVALGGIYITIACMWLLLSNGSLRGLSPPLPAPEEQSCMESFTAAVKRIWIPLALFGFVVFVTLYFTLIHKAISDVMWDGSDYSLHRWTVLHRTFAVFTIYGVTKALHALDHMCNTDTQPGWMRKCFFIRCMFAFFGVLFLYFYDTMQRMSSIHEPSKLLYLGCVICMSLFVACDTLINVSLVHSVLSSEPTGLQRCKALADPRILKIVLWLIMVVTVLSVFGQTMSAYHSDYTSLRNECSMDILEARLRFGHLQIHDPGVTSAASRNQYVIKCTASCNGNQTLDTANPCHTDLADSSCCARVSAVFTLGEYRPTVQATLTLLVVYHIVYGAVGLCIELLVAFGKLSEDRPKQIKTTKQEFVPLTSSYEPTISDTEVDLHKVAEFNTIAESQRLVPDPLLVLGQEPESLRSDQESQPPEIEQEPESPEEDQYPL